MRCFNAGAPSSEPIPYRGVARRFRLLGTLVLLCFTLGTPVAATTQPPASEAVFRKLILERIRAYGRGDVGTYLGMLTDDFAHVSDLGARRTKERMRAFVGGHGDNRASYDVATLSWRTRGDVAIVDAEVHEHRPHMEDRLVFLRDRSGKVAQCLWHLPSGQTIVSHRLQ